MSLLHNLFGAAPTANLQNLIDQGAFLVDVREPAEFATGSVQNAVNIPLGTVAAQIATFKGKENIIVFCKSGNRSGQAKTILEQHGIQNVVNGGSWENVRQYTQ